MAFSEKIKDKVRERANFTCCWCDTRHHRIQVHHIVPQSEGGSDDIDNAAPLCPSCHSNHGDNPKLRTDIRNRRDHLYARYSGVLAEPPPPPPDPQISTARLPATGETFVAREEELAQLDAAWEDSETQLIAFVAMGGAGKSALVNAWLDRFKKDAWRGAERVLGWSFYSQGTDSTGASSDAFTDFALDFLGYDGDEITSPWRRGEVIANLIKERRTLLVLDGLEPLQHPPGGQTGRLKDPAMQALVRELARQNPGLCVVTTRIAVADVAGRAGAVTVDLEQLPPASGAELLKRLGVKGSEEELRTTSEEFGGHGLALTLLGTYLRDIEDGDVRKRREVPTIDPDAQGGAHAERVMESYAEWLGEGPELQVLRLLGLFDRPADPAALAAVRAEPEIPGLTDGLGTGEETAWKRALALLRQARLVAPAEGGESSANNDNNSGLDAHPLVRAYFGERLRTRSEEAWKAGHARLDDHYRQSTDDQPDTLEGLLPLYAAVVHGCRAGRVQEVFDEVYWRRIRRGNEAFSVKKLGAFGAELTALAAFFERPWDRPSAALSAPDRAWILNEAGIVLRALGRLPEAVQPFKASLEAAKDLEDWKEAAIRAGNLSELHLTLGEVASAVETGEESVELAETSGDLFQRMSKRTTLADALHQAGRLEESAAAFREAEALQAESQPEYPRLYSLAGYRYCDLLLSGALTPQQILERAQEAMDWELEMPGAPILDFALHHLTLARAHLALGQDAPAAEHFDRAVDGLRQAGQDEFIVRGLLHRATHHRLRGDLESATRDLEEAQEIAERGSMRLHLADAHLGWTHLHLRDNPEQARHHLERARSLVEATGYGRRAAEIHALETGLTFPPPIATIEPQGQACQDRRENLPTGHPPKSRTRTAEGRDGE